MIDRRTFMNCCVAVAGMAFVCGTATAQNIIQKPDKDNSGVTGYDYTLPHLKKGANILFQGDSISDMKRGRNENDKNHFLGHSYIYLIAARLGVDMPNSGYQFHTRGVSGNRVSQLRARWKKDAIDIKPDLLTILIGTNDASGNVPLDQFENDYRYILTISRQANPNLKIVLLDPFVLQTGRFADATAYKNRRKLLSGYCQIVAKLAKEFDALHIRTQEIFDKAAKIAPPSHWIWDGIHPLPQGHELIARNWIREVSNRWP